MSDTLSDPGVISYESSHENVAASDAVSPQMSVLSQNPSQSQSHVSTPELSMLSPVHAGVTSPTVVSLDIPAMNALPAASMSALDSNSNDASTNLKARQKMKFMRAAVTSSSSAKVISMNTPKVIGSTGMPVVLTKTHNSLIPTPIVSPTLSTTSSAVTPSNVNTVREYHAVALIKAGKLPVGVQVQFYTTHFPNQRIGDWIVLSKSAPPALISGQNIPPMIHDNSGTILQVTEASFCNTPLYAHPYITVASELLPSNLITTEEGNSIFDQLGETSLCFCGKSYSKEDEQPFCVPSRHDFTCSLGCISISSKKEFIKCKVLKDLMNLIQQDSQYWCSKLQLSHFISYHGVRKVKTEDKLYPVVYLTRLCDNDLSQYYTVDSCEFTISKQHISRADLMRFSTLQQQQKQHIRTDMHISFEGMNFDVSRLRQKVGVEHAQVKSNSNPTTHHNILEYLLHPESPSLQHQYYVDPATQEKVSFVEYMQQLQIHPSSTNPTLPASSMRSTNTSQANAQFKEQDDGSLFPKILKLENIRGTKGQSSLVQVSPLTQPKQVSVVIGLLGPSTHITFRSLSTSQFLLIEVSQEMYTGDGVTWILAQQQQLLATANKMHTTHRLCVVLFGRTVLQPITTNGMNTNRSAHVSSRQGTTPTQLFGTQGKPVQVDSDFVINVAPNGQFFQDFYSVVFHSQWSSSTPLDTMLNLVRVEQVNLAKRFQWTNTSYFTNNNSNNNSNNTDSNISITYSSEISPSQDAAVLEALSLACTLAEQHYLDRSLTQSGQHMVILSAGQGGWCTKLSLSRLIAKRISDLGIGVDVIVRKSKLTGIVQCIHPEYVPVVTNLIQTEEPGVQPSPVLISRHPDSTGHLPFFSAKANFQSTLTRHHTFPDHKQHCLRDITQIFSYDVASSAFVPVRKTPSNSIEPTDNHSIAIPGYIFSQMHWMQQMMSPAEERPSTFSKPTLVHTDELETPFTPYYPRTQKHKHQSCALSDQFYTFNPTLAIAAPELSLPIYTDINLLLTNTMSTTTLKTDTIPLSMGAHPLYPLFCDSLTTAQFSDENITTQILESNDQTFAIRGKSASNLLIAHSPRLQNLPFTVMDLSLNTSGQPTHPIELVSRTCGTGAVYSLHNSLYLPGSDDEYVVLPINPLNKKNAKELLVIAPCSPFYAAHKYWYLFRAGCSTQSHYARWGSIYNSSETYDMSFYDKDALLNQNSLVYSPNFKRSALGMHYTSLQSPALLPQTVTDYPNLFVRSNLDLFHPLNYQKELTGTEAQVKEVIERIFLQRQAQQMQLLIVPDQVNRSKNNILLQRNEGIQYITGQQLQSGDNAAPNESKVEDYLQTNAKNANNRIFDPLFPPVQTNNSANSSRWIVVGQGQIQMLTWKPQQKLYEVVGFEENRHSLTKENNLLPSSSLSLYGPSSVVSSHRDIRSVTQQQAIQAKSPSLLGNVPRNMKLCNECEPETQNFLQTSNSHLTSLPYVYLVYSPYVSKFIPAVRRVSQSSELFNWSHYDSTLMGTQEFEEELQYRRVRYAILHDMVVPTLQSLQLLTPCMFTLNQLLSHSQSPQAMLTPEMAGKDWSVASSPFGKTMDASYVESILKLALAELHGVTADILRSNECQGLETVFHTVYAQVEQLIAILCPYLEHLRSLDVKSEFLAQCCETKEKAYLDPIYHAVNRIAMTRLCVYLKYLAESNQLLSITTPILKEAYPLVDQAIASKIAYKTHTKAIVNMSLYDNNHKNTAPATLKSFHLTCMGQHSVDGGFIYIQPSTAKIQLAADENASSTIDQTSFFHINQHDKARYTSKEQLLLMRYSHCVHPYTFSTIESRWITTPAVKTATVIQKLSHHAAKANISLLQIPSRQPIAMLSNPFVMPITINMPNVQSLETVVLSIVNSSDDDWRVTSNTLCKINVDVDIVKAIDYHLDEGSPKAHTVYDKLEQLWNKILPSQMLPWEQQWLYRDDKFVQEPKLVLLHHPSSALIRVYQDYMVWIPNVLHQQHTYDSVRVFRDIIDKCQEIAKQV